MTKTSLISRRVFSAGAVSLLGLSVAGCSGQASTSGTENKPSAAWAREVVQMYGPRPNERFPIPAVNLKEVDAQFYRQEVDFETDEPVGSIIVNTETFFAYFVMPAGRAMRYGVGLGRAGFAWSGRANIAWKRKWPTWTPPTEMIARQPELEEYSAANGGMEPGLHNPLGARALYIFRNGKDTLYRLHGTLEAFSIGKAVSSGCVRFLNQDIMDLYERVGRNARILVI